MRSSLFPAIVCLALVLVLGLAACTAQPASPAATVAAATEATPVPAVTAAGDTSVPTAASTPTTAGAVSFSKDVLPILQAKCAKCHGVEKVSKGLNVTSYDQLMAGSTNGPVLVPGDASNSKMIALISQGRMPKREPKLPDDQILILINWINAGAPNN